MIRLRADFQAFKDYENSDELKHYLELEKEVTSSDFALRKKKILKEKYKASEAFRKEETIQPVDETFQGR